MLKTFTTEFEEIAKDPYLRSNFKTLFFSIKIKNRLNNSSNKFIRLKDIFNIISGYAFKSSDYEDEGIPLIRISDVGNEFNESNLVFLPEEYKSKYSKYLLKQNDIIVSLTGDGKIKSGLIKENDKYLLNQRVGALRAKKNINIKFYFYLINSLSFVKDQFYWWSNGKTQLNISPFDLLKIKIPYIPKSIQDQIVSQIQVIEKEIKNLKSQIKDPRQVINQVFAEEFGFDLEKFEETKKEKFFEIDFASFGKNRDLRFSVKFYRVSYSFVVRELLKINTKKIKDIISEPIVLGCGISPNNYDENGEYYYISMATIKNWNLDIENTRQISYDFVSKNNWKLVKKDDILLARSGEGTIGKVALIERDVKGIFADFVMRIRVNKSYSPLFVYYYFRTSYFQYLIEINKKGLGNNTNIFPSQIQEFPIPDIPLSRQQEIVDKIKTELDKQQQIKQKIEKLRNEIDEIIEKTLKEFD